jgi:hypothetical protein
MKLCTIEGCSIKVQASGLCHKHYNYKWYQNNTEKARETGRKWREANPEEAKNADKRSKCNRYGMTVEEYDVKLASQNGVCVVCKRLPTENIPLGIDHDHNCCNSGCRSCGKCVRGLLCRNCNNALGAINDNISILENLIIYLRSYQ